MMEECFSAVQRYIRIKSLSKTDREDYFLSLIALIQFPFVFVQLLLISFGWSEESTTIYRVILSAVSILFALPMILKRKGRKFMGCYLFIGVIYSMHYFLYPSTIKYWHESGLRFLIPICIPTLFCVLSLRNLECFYVAVKQICYITAICGLIFGIRLVTGDYFSEETYFMNYGFLLLLPIIVFMLENTWYSIPLSILFLLFVIVFGSRGPLIAVAVFTIFFIIRKKKFLLLTIVVSLAIIGYSTFASYLDSMGLSSRTILMLLDGEMMNDTGRDEIQSVIFKGITENPILGNGIYGDRVLSKGYAHNFFIEVICHYGFIIGGILLFLLLYKILYITCNLRGKHKDVFVAMMCILFLPLMTSGSYLQEPNFFIFIGLMVVMRKIIRKEKTVEQRSHEPLMIA